jgi:secondary thiamine-phosphate synthase enzyme
MATAMKVFQHETRLRTAGGLTLTDITEDVQNAVRESGVIEDFCDLLRRLVPHDSYYAHDDWDRRTENICPEDMDQGNGHSHCMAMLLGTAGESVPVRDGELQLGTWQRVLFIELDRERDRRWLVQVVGA